MQISLAGKRVLVTGADSGIGAGIARALSGAGAKVAINDVMHPEVASSMVGEIEGKGGVAGTSVFVDGAMTDDPEFGHGA